MAYIMACRICLTTTGRLWKMYENNLFSAYNCLTGITMSPQDSYPKYVCSMCGSLLLKCDSFRQKCLKTQQLLEHACEEQNQLTEDYINFLATNHKTHHSLTTTHISDGDTIVLPELTIKFEFEPSDNEMDDKDTFVLKEDPLSEDDTKSPSHTQSQDYQITTTIPVEIPIKLELESSEDEPIIQIKKKVQQKRKPIRKKIIKKKVEPKKIKKVEPKKIKTVEPKIKKIVDKVKNLSDSSDETDGDDDEKKKNNFELVFFTKEQQIQEIEGRKETLNYLNSFHKCEYCYRGFLTESTYKNHMLKHDPTSGPHICEICKVRYPKKSSLKRHKAFAHENSYICNICGHKTRNLHQANTHMEWHQGRTYDCQICGATFNKSTSQLTHLRKHHPSNFTKFTCDVCGENFLGEFGLKVHKSKAHRNEKEFYICPICSFQFKSNEALDKHTGLSNGVQCDPCTCTHCGENLLTKEALSDHIFKEHKYKGSVKCNECNKCFLTDRSRSMHYQRVHPRKPDARRELGIVCEICGKKCMSKQTLQVHQRKHTGEKPFQCPECPKSFNVLRTMQNHRCTHSGLRPFKCPECPKAFKTSSTLFQHARVHTGIKPYACTECGKTFTQSSSLKLHKNSVHLKLPSPYKNRARTSDMDVKHED